MATKFIMKDSKAQVQIVSAVLLVGILAAGISAAYLWGVPLLQKNQDVNEIDNAINSLKELSSTIESISVNKGTQSVDFKIKGLLKIIPENSTIEYITNSRAAYVATSSWVTLNEDDTQGTFILPSGYGILGEDHPGVLLAKAEPQSKTYVNDFRLVFRELDDLNSNKGQKINLKVSGAAYKTSGKHKIVVKYDGDKIIPKGSKTGGDLREINILIQII